MVEFETFIYLDLHKTASQHIAAVLRRASGQQILYRKVHEPLSAPPSKIVLGSVRNPWDWYVSLWAYGCSGKGFLRRRLVMGDQDFATLYADVNDPERFRRWLALLTSVEFARSGQLKEGYTRSGVYDQVGFYTYRYLRLNHFEFEAWAARTRWKPRFAIRRYHRREGVVDFHVRQERLEDDLVEFLTRFRPFPVTAEALATIRTGGERNVTQRSRELRLYYDDASWRRVEKREWLILRRFGYGLTADGQVLPA